ncbi:MAG: Re/Si-specific NAD(P)(+) transhydrogenase subunit alpha [Calditrichia bacterium]
MDKKELVIGVPKEIYEKCRCVAMVPDSVKNLVNAGHRVLVQKEAGVNAYYPNDYYEKAGATIIGSAAELYGEADVIIKIRMPLFNRELNKHELDLLKKHATILSFLQPTLEPKIVEKLIRNELTGFSMELIPRISRAQSMDALSSLSTVMGYRAVLVAVNMLGKFFPLLMTAAGTIRPATVLVIGAGVAGLQAIATSRRLGAKVEAFDTRPAVKEQVESLGARFIEMELPENMETRYGYAKEASREFIKKEMEAIAARLPKTDVVISTALVYGRKAPVLINEEMVKMMPPGSVIVDLAAEQGGNCELSKPGRTVEKYDVSIYGAVDVPSQLPLHTSLMYSKNVVNAFNNLYAGEDDSIDLEDEINANALVTYKGEIISPMVKESFNKKDPSETENSSGKGAGK